jgi:membrane protein DedA with SNARE-associated domain
MNEIQEYLVDFLRPATFVVWGLILLAIAWSVSSHAAPDGSFFVRHLFALMLVSWLAGVVLVVRVTMRRSRRDPHFLR